MCHEAALAPGGHTRDEGRSLRAALQGEGLSHLKLLEVERPQVVSVEEKEHKDVPGMDQEDERLAIQWERRNRGTMVSKVGSV
jgi:hypothetical protein